MTEIRHSHFFRDALAGEHGSGGDAQGVEARSGVVVFDAAAREEVEPFFGGRAERFVGFGAALSLQSLEARKQFWMQQDGMGAPAFGVEADHGARGADADLGLRVQVSFAEPAAVVAGDQKRVEEKLFFVRRFLADGQQDAGECGARQFGFLAAKLAVNVQSAPRVVVGEAFTDSFVHDDGHELHFQQCGIQAGAIFAPRFIGALAPMEVETAVGAQELARSGDGVLVEKHLEVAPRALGAQFFFSVPQVNGIENPAVPGFVWVVGGDGGFLAGEFIAQFAGAYELDQLGALANRFAGAGVAVFDPPKPRIFLLKYAGHSYVSLCLRWQKFTETQREMNDFANLTCARIVSPVQFRLLPPLFIKGVNGLALRLFSLDFARFGGISFRTRIATLHLGKVRNLFVTFVKVRRCGKIRPRLSRQNP